MKKNINKTNVLKALGSIVFVTLLIFSMTACDDGSGNSSIGDTTKTMTITGLSEHNGEKAYFFGTDNDEIFTYKNNLQYATPYFDIRGELEKTINNGTLTSDVKVTGLMDTDYTGNDSYWVGIIIGSSPANMWIYKGDVASPDFTTGSNVPKVSFSPDSITLDFSKFVKTSNN